MWRTALTRLLLVAGISVSFTYEKGGVRQNVPKQPKKFRNLPPGFLSSRFPLSMLAVHAFPISPAIPAHEDLWQSTSERVGRAPLVPPGHRLTWGCDRGGPPVGLGWRYWSERLAERTAALVGGAVRHSAPERKRLLGAARRASRPVAAGPTRV